MFDPDGFNQSAERAIFWTRAQLESAGRAAADPREALGVPRRAAPQPPRERLPLRPRLGPQPAQRVRLPRRRLQPAEDGTHLRAGRDVLLPGAHARPGHLHREHAVPEPRGSGSRLQARRPQDAVQRRLASASRATATGGRATSCSTTTRSSSAASSTTGRRPATRSTTSPTWTTSSATGSARGGKVVPSVANNLEPRGDTPGEPTDAVRGLYLLRY